MFYTGRLIFIKKVHADIKIHDDALDEGYNVVRAVKETIMLYKINRYTIR